MKKQIGIQMFSLGNILKKHGMKAGLITAKALGFDSVEFAGGYYDMTPAEIKEFLDEYGMDVSGAHIHYKTIDGEYAGTVDGLHTLGAYSVCVPSIGLTEPDAWAEFGGKLDVLGAKLKKDGLVFGYHNHATEFKSFPDGRRPIDILLANCSAENVFFELDTRHAHIAGCNAAEEARRFSGRIKVLHARDTDMTVDTAIGSGVVDFKAVVKNSPGIERLVVETGVLSDNFELLRLSAEYLKKNIVPIA